MKKGVLLITIGMVIVVIAYFGVQMFESVKGVQKDIQQNETKLEQKPIVKLTKFKNGRWISTVDPLSGIEIKNGKWTMFYKGMKTNSSNIYDYNIRKEHRKEMGNEHKPIEFLTLTNDSDTLEYAILEYSDRFMSLSYTPRGSILNYEPEKKGSHTPAKTEINHPKTDVKATSVTLDTKHCYINKIIVKNGKKYVVADYVDFLIGDQAIEKAKENDDAHYDMDEKGDTLYFVNNDYYVSNINAKLRTLELADDVTIEVWDFPKNNGVFNTVNINELENHLGSKPIMILTIENGVIIKIKEQFVP